MTPNLVHRVTPRFKSLLHECHMTGNLCSDIFLNVSIVLAFYALQLVGAVMQASLAGGTQANIQTGEAAGGGGICVPAWCFGVVFQPTLSLIVFIYYFGESYMAESDTTTKENTNPNPDFFLTSTYTLTHPPSLPQAR